MFKKFIVALGALIAATAFAAVDANTATQAELESVKGIGPAISTKIIDERGKGAFKDWNDMVVRVKGVGDKNATTFSQAGLTVNGAAFPGAPARTEPSTMGKAASAVKGGAEKAAAATKATASKAASAVKGGASTVAGDVKEQKDAVKQNVADAKEKSAEKKAAKAEAKAEKKAEKAAAASAAASTTKK